MASVLREIIIDCRDAGSLARFWSDVLGWPVTDEPEDGCSWVSATGDEDNDDLVILFAPVPEPKTLKNRIHLDVNPSNCDQAEELERLLALGARPVDVGQGEQTWVVLADPEGNEFCLLRRRFDR